MRWHGIAPLNLSINIKKILTNIKTHDMFSSSKAMEGSRMKLKLGKIITKILEVFHWVGAALMLAAAVCSVAAPNWVKYFVGFDAKECCGAELAVYGFTVNAPVTNGAVDMTAFLMFGIGAVLILAVMAMAFRNLHLIFKKSEHGTPFQKE